MGKKVLLFWLASELVFMLTFLMFDHEPVKLVAVISYSIQWLLFVICIMVVRYEPIQKNKYIFLNFALFFSISLLFHAYNFVGKALFAEQQFAKMYFNQYVAFGAYFFLLAFAVVYLCLDALFRDFKALYKYALALSIVGVFFTYYYHGYISNPKYLYTTTEAHT